MTILSGNAAGQSSRKGILLPRDPALKTLFTVGDSTVHNGDNGQVGWGEPLVAYFDSSKINVVNRALGGRSSRTYMTEGHWNDTLQLIKPGDVVLFQFGHNDGGPLDDPGRARGTLPGIGEETKDIQNPITNQPETVHTYGWYMRKYIADTQAKGAIPVICSPIPKNQYNNGKIIRESASYGGWARQIAGTAHVDFIDLNDIIADEYDRMTPAQVGALFAPANPPQIVHTNQAGAELNARAVVAGLKGLANDPVDKFFSPLGQAVPPASTK